MTMPDEPSKDVRALAGTARRALRLRVVLASGIALALLAIVALPVFSTLQPAYYERYESLAERMRYWRTSTHGFMSCASCHVDPGATNVIRFGAKSIPAFYSQLVSGPQRTNLLGTPTREACQKCHTSYRQISPAGDLRIPHRAHVEVLKMDCSVCHERLVHYASDRGFNRPKMSMCMSLCHDGRQATDECVKCHTQKQVPASHKAPDWLQSHSAMTAKDDCAACHAWTPDYCETCHAERPKSHSGNWKKDHQVPARERGDGCLVCHGGEKFCKQCHD